MVLDMPLRSFRIFTEEFISKASLLRNLPLPLFAKEGYIPSLWQRSVRLATEEVRRDFIINVFILMTLLVNAFAAIRPDQKEKDFECL